MKILEIICLVIWVLTCIISLWNKEVPNGMAWAGMIISTLYYIEKVFLKQ